jgi:hypothetical protein
MKTLTALLLLSAVFTTDYPATLHQIDKEALINTWVQDGYEDGKIVYSRHDDFVPDRPGVAFKNDNKLFKRQNAGWCGTPPITYRNYSGTWEWTSDTQLTMRYQYWGGEAELDWQIHSLTSEQMVIEVLEHRKVEK